MIKIIDFFLNMVIVIVLISGAFATFSIEEKLDKVIMANSDCHNGWEHP